MKATDLIIGDWVIRRGVPEEPMRVYDMKASTGIVYLEQDGRGIAEQFYNIEPIPLMPEILEANNFLKDPDYTETYWRPDCSKFCFVKECDDWYFAICYKGGHICIAKCNYVHKLQHILIDLLGVDTEVVVRKYKTL